MCKRNEECDKLDPNMGCLNGVCLCNKGYALNSNSRCNLVVEPNSWIEKFLQIICMVIAFIMYSFCMIGLMRWFRCCQKNIYVDPIPILSDLSHLSPANRVQRRSSRQRLRSTRSNSVGNARFIRLRVSLDSPAPTSRTQSLPNSEQAFVALPLSSSLLSPPAYESAANSAPINAHISSYSDEPPNYEEAVAISFQNKN